jgi:HSP20 family protein
VFAGFREEKIMPNIMRRDPAADVAISEPLRELGAFVGWPRLSRLFQDLPREPSIRLDVTEDDNAYHVKADLPGVKKEDIDVEVSGNEVSLSAEVKREKSTRDGEKRVHSERYYGRQYRSFTLPCAIDRKKAEAKFADGVLELTLPKEAGAKGQRLAVR